MATSFSGTPSSTTINANSTAMPEVSCPVCNGRVLEKNINKHLDSGCKVALVVIQAKDTPIAPIFDRSGPSKVEHPPTPTPAPLKRKASMKTPDPKRGKTTVDTRSHVPLAERLRPQTLDDFVGQSHLTGADSLLRNVLTSRGSSESAVFWGPPGCGKTTLARLLAKSCDAAFKELSATDSGIAQLREAFEEAKNLRKLTRRKTILFFDEIHRFNKAQQDIFLPYVEQGHVQLIGATTENPSFKLNAALLSRCRVFVFERLTESDIERIVLQGIRRVSHTDDKPVEIDHVDNDDVFNDPNVPSSQDTSYSLHSGADKSVPQLSPKVLASLVSLADGDARTALSLLALVLGSSPVTDEATLLKALRQSVSTSYDRTGDSHYDMISALHKSVRGSEGSAAMYWLARMLTAGEDPVFIARRMVVCASEDIGLADNAALSLAVATLQACQNVGMPECRINLAHLVAYLSEAPKSTRAYEAYKRAEAVAKDHPSLPVPMQVRNAPTGLMQRLGYGDGYRYQPDYRHPVTNDYVPDEIKDMVFLKPEGDISDKLWDEDVLRRWELKKNHGMPWEGRTGDHSMNDT